MEGGKEGWKLDEPGQRSHHQISPTLPDFSIYAAVPHLYTACGKKKDFVYSCIIFVCVSLCVCVANPPAFL